MMLIPLNMKPVLKTNQGMVSCSKNVSGRSRCAWPWGWSNGEGDRSGLLDEALGQVRPWNLKHPDQLNKLEIEF